jgi:2-amino-4-hydroxy-6-hydroxymethyldihydropteridine diphosphokinase
VPFHAYLSLGSNLGDREHFLRSAMERLRSLGELRAVSRLYETEPVEFTAQPDFLNCAAVLATELEPEALLAGLRAIEHALGRPNRDGTTPAVAEIPKGPRTIDLDILLFDDRVLAGETLKVPHPAMHERRFVLATLAEIAPEAVHPLLGRTVRELLLALPQGPPVVEPVESPGWPHEATEPTS